MHQLLKVEQLIHFKAVTCSSHQLLQMSSDLLLTGVLLPCLLEIAVHSLKGFGSQLPNGTSGNKGDMELKQSDVQYRQDPGKVFKVGSRGLCAT